MTDLLSETPFANRLTTNKVFPEYNRNIPNNDNTDTDDNTKKNDPDHVYFGKFQVPRPQTKEKLVNMGISGERIRANAGISTSLTLVDSAVSIDQYNATFQMFVQLFKKENDIVAKAFSKQQKQKQRQHYITMPLNCNEGRNAMGSYPMEFNAHVRSQCIPCCIGWFITTILLCYCLSFHFGRFSFSSSSSCCYYCCGNSNPEFCFLYCGRYHLQIQDTKHYHSPGLNNQDLGEARTMVYPMIDLIYMACHEGSLLV